MVNALAGPGRYVPLDRVRGGAGPSVLPRDATLACWTALVLCAQGWGRQEGDGHNQQGKAESPRVHSSCWCAYRFGLAAR